MAEIAQKVAEYVINPIVNQFKYLFCHVKNIQNLRDELGTLERQRLSVDVVKRNTDIFDENIKAWLENVDKIKKEADDVLNITVNYKTQCLCLSPNLKIRYWHGRKATKITTTIVGLQKEGVFHIPTPLEQMSIHVPSERDDEGLETRISTRNEIIEALKDEESYIIGICGMPGVGKTTMAHEIASEVQKVFDEVFIAVVSRVPDIKKIQDQIVGKNIQGIINECVRAGLVHHRLTYDVDKKFLVILDDVWEEVDLKKMGVPKKGDRKGLKILLTTRFKSVCDIMEANKIYVVEVLPENEAFKLLKDVSKISDDDTSEVVKGLAAQVAKECGGLPLSLAIIGKSLINRDDYAWRDVLRQLKNGVERVQKQVYEVIGYSYNKFTGDVKSLFLLCSLFPEDYNISIETLVRYAWGLDMSRDCFDTLFDTRNEVNLIIFYLQNSYLLLLGKREGEVKLHDVVRDFCLLIASQGKHVYMAKHNGLKEWPEHVDDNSHTAISLTFDDEPNELPSGLEYPNLKLLRLVSEKMKISNDFFLKMNQLRVLQFNCSLWQIPSSLQHLTNLQTLCMDMCVLNCSLSTIGSLKKLEILSFFKSYLSEFPIEIAHLSNLKSLDLRFSKGPHPLPRGVLSSLNKLEELYLGAHFATWWDEKGDYKVEKEYIIAELSTLKGLHTFQICTHDPEFLLEMLKRMSLEKLQGFQIICTSGERTEGDHHFGRSLHLDKVESSMVRESIISELLLWRTDNLFLRVKDPVKNFVNEIDEDGFVNLNTLSLWDCSVKCLVDTSGFEGLKVTKRFIFGPLRSLKLYGLPTLEHIVRRVHQGIRVFTNLTSLEVKGCNSLRYLFSTSVASWLSGLETLSIGYCETIEKIIEREGGEEISAIKPAFIDRGGGELYKLVFPKLSTVKLIKLQSLRTFCFENIELIFPSLHKLVIAACPVMEKFASQEPIAPKLKKMQTGIDRFVDFSNVLDPLGLVNVEDVDDLWD